MDYSAYLKLFGEPGFWLLVLELVIVPRFLIGPDYGLVRFLNWFKETFKLKGKTVPFLNVPVMTVVAGVFSVLAAAVVMLVDGTLRNVAPTPEAVIGVGLAFFALGQSWYGIIKSKVDLQTLRARMFAGDESN